jgi:transcription initiation factor TFIIE subunit beta
VQPTHNVTGKDGLLALIADFRDGIPVKEVEDAYPSVLDDLQVTKLFMIQGFSR